MTALRAFETFERRLESTLTGHCRSWRWTGSETRTSLSSFRRTSVVIILGQSRAAAWPRKISEKRSGPDRASSLRGCWPRDERSAAIERRGRADVERPPVAVAPVEVAGHFRDTDHAEYLTVRREDMNPARAGAEQIAFGVDFHAIRHSRLVALEDGPDLASGNAVLPQLEPTNVHLRCVVDEEN